MEYLLGLVGRLNESVRNECLAGDQLVLSGIIADCDVTAAVCLALSHLFSPQPWEGRMLMIPTAQVVGLQSQARACVWWFFCWVTLGRLLALSKPRFPAFLLTWRPGQVAGLRTCENQAALTSGPTPSQPPPLRPLLVAPKVGPGLSVVCGV